MFEAERKSDIECLSAKYLIAHIDNAFRMRQSSWVSEYSFEHFCNYVLPYRICEEPISDWMDTYAAKYAKDLASYTNQQQDKFQMYGVCNAFIQKENAYLHYFNGYVPELPLSFLPSVKIGDCYTYTKHCIAHFRALGIPAAFDFTPQWGNRSMGHAWPVFLPDAETFIPFDIDQPMGDFRFHRPDNRLPKVFRRTYAKQPEMQSIYESKELIPELFQTLCIRDVTHFYMETSDVNVSLFPNVKSKYVYLAVFDNRDWQIVHFAERQGSKALFPNMGRGIVYLPVTYNRMGQLLPAGHPFILNLDGSIRILQANDVEKETVRLVRKYSDSYAMKLFCKEIKGGKFQVANRKDFSDSITVATIGDLNEVRFHELTSSDAGKYRYFRYLAAPDSKHNMAEVEVYNENGHRITSKHIFDEVSSFTAQYLYDNDVLTYYISQPAKDGSVWVAVEFEKPECVTKVRFLPRNDDNFIRDGEVYQLFYWNGIGWKQVEEVTGNYEGILHIENVPTNALLLLHNATRGVEERIFTYEKGEQVWW